MNFFAWLLSLRKPKPAPVRAPKPAPKPAPIPTPVPPKPVPPPPTPIPPPVIVVVSPPGKKTAPAPVNGGGFTTPNILNNASFEAGWDNWSDWTFSPPGAVPVNVTRDNTMAAPGGGSWSAKYAWLANPSDELEAQFTYNLSPGRATGFDRIWIRYYLKLTSGITTHFKFNRFYDGGSNESFGGFYLGQNSSLFMMGWDKEDGPGLTIPTGITETMVVDGNWHYIELDYWRNGDPSGYPSAAFYLDGTQIFSPNGGTGGTSFWLNGRLYAGERNSSAQMYILENYNTLNIGNTRAGQVNCDLFSISSLGRIGP